MSKVLLGYEVPTPYLRDGLGFGSGMLSHVGGIVP